MRGNKGSFLIGQPIADFRLDSKEIRKIKIMGNVFFLRLFRINNDLEKIFLSFSAGMRFSRNSENKFQKCVLNYLPIYGTIHNENFQFFKPFIKLNVELFID